MSDKELRQRLVKAARRIRLSLLSNVDPRFNAALQQDDTFKQDVLELVTAIILLEGSPRSNPWEDSL